MPEVGSSQAVQTFLAFDFGTRRTGVAVGNTLLGHARPLKVIETQIAQRRFDEVAKLLNEWQPEALVVGRPTHPDGAEHDMTMRCERFARQLNGRFHLPVHMVDERYSSESDDDSQAAAVILQQYFDSIAQPPQPAK
jgi:putative holliday junction resolvase